MLAGVSSGVWVRGVAGGARAQSEAARKCSAAGAPALRTERARCRRAEKDGVPSESGRHGGSCVASGGFVNHSVYGGRRARTSTAENVPTKMMNGSAGVRRAGGDGDAEDRRDQPFKVLIVGGSSVGKTCILRRFVDGEFPNKCKATLGLDFKIRCVQVGDGLIKMQLWDTSGQERFRSMTQAYYRGAAGIMVVYDVTEQATLAGLEGWLADIKKYAPEDVDIIILGNKCDTVEHRTVPREAGEEFARSKGLKFFETSAQDNTNIMEAFEAMAALLSSKITEHRKRVNSIAITSPVANGNGGRHRKDSFRPGKLTCAC